MMEGAMVSQPHEPLREEGEESDACPKLVPCVWSLSRALRSEWCYIVRNEVFSSTSVVSTLKASWVKAVASSVDERHERRGREGKKRRRACGQRCAQKCVLQD